MSEFDEKLNRFCFENADAVALIRGFWKMCVTWDHLVDKDEDVPAKLINEAFTWALFDAPVNPVYRQNPALIVVLRTVIANWFAANELQKAPTREQKITAYTLRCCPYDFFVAVVLCVSGPEMADEAALWFRGSPNDDRLEDFLREHME